MSMMMKSRLRLLSLLLLALAFVLSGLMVRAQASGTAGNNFNLSQAVSQLKTVNGVSGDRWMHNGKPTYLKFWASWCPLCLSQLKETVAFAKKHPDVNVVTVLSPSYLGEMDTQKATQWLKGLKEAKGLVVLLDPLGTIASKLNINVYPSAAFITAGGELARVQKGSLTPVQIEAIFNNAYISDAQLRLLNMNAPKNDFTRPADAGPTKTIYLAGGCFWGLEAYMERIGGVVNAEVGYANGHTEDPSYQDVIAGSGHAETVKVEYDPKVISLQTLLQYYFRVIDPTSINQQGNDRGLQYRTGIYYTDKADLPAIEEVYKAVQKQYPEKLQVQVMPLKNFYLAEEYHQDYLLKNPNGYCHIDLNKADDVIIDLHKYKKEDEAQLEKKLSAEEFQVTQNAATEHPFENKFWNFFEPGLYVDITNGQPLFASNDKYNSQCGWPSFTRPIAPNVVQYYRDTSYNMVRTEVRSASSGAHLGHVFEDGPRDRGGLRYCINSAALRFIPVADMEKEGYGYLIKRVTEKE